MYSFLRVVARSRAREERKQQGRKSERDRRNEPFALFSREKKAENERRGGGKGERGPHKYSSVDGRRQGEEEG